MIAVCQTNRCILRKIHPEKMMGIKVKGDEVYFYAFTLTSEYLDDLKRGLPNTPLNVSKFPDKRGLCMLIPEERKQLLSCLWVIRAHAFNQLLSNTLFCQPFFGKIAVVGSFLLESMSFKSNTELRADSGMSMLFLPNFFEDLPTIIVTR